MTPYYFSPSHNWLLTQPDESQKAVRSAISTFAKAWRRVGGYEALGNEFARYGMNANLERFKDFRDTESIALRTLMELDPAGGEYVARERLVELAIEYHGVS